MKLGDHCEQNQGGIEPLLNDVEQPDLWQALQEPPPDDEGGCGMGVLVANWIAQLIGRPVSHQRGWEYFKQMRC